MTNRDDAHRAARGFARLAGVEEWPRIRRRRRGRPTGLCGLLVLCGIATCATGICMALGDGEAAGAGAIVVALLMSLVVAAAWEGGR